MAVKRQKITNRFAIYNDDCIKVVRGIPDNSVGFTIYSPPFADLFSYSDSDADMGNCRSYKEFFEHYEYLVTEHQRTMMSGRIVAVHCMDLPIFKNVDGHMGMRDFPGDIIRCFLKHDFTYHSRHCIWKDPLIAATRTKAIGLAHKQIVKDSSVCRTGMPDYVVAFRKHGDNPEPIKHPMGLSNYVGERTPPTRLNTYTDQRLYPEGYQEPKTNKMSHWIWQQYASPVWDDIRQTRVLPYREAREKDDERHICPLQRDVVERCLILWSNPGDTVLSPFAGVGTEIFEAVRLGRKGIGVELKTAYYRMMQRNLESLERKKEAETNDNWA